MLSSNSSSCNQNPNHIPFFENEITSFTSKLVEDPNFFPGFPNSPYLHFEYDDVYLQALFDHFYQQSADTPADVHADLDTNNLATVAAAGELTTAARSRGLKRDRHSKIHTARGPRDRRMRLSLDIARRFFDLQDMLGYDKASRTVDWLLRNCSSAIAELERRSRGVCNNSESCTSEEYCCEALSSKMSTTTTITSSTSKKVKKRRVLQKRATVARESRRKARERARERTSQKRRLMRENTTAAVDNHFSSDISGATAHELVCQWNAAFLEQDEQIAEFQFNGNPWQTYNSFNVSGSAISF